MEKRNDRGIMLKSTDCGYRVLGKTQSLKSPERYQRKLKGQINNRS